jgi:hypothetical protein
MVAEVRPKHPSDLPAIKAVAGKLGIGSVNGSARLRSTGGRGWA